MSKVRFNLIVVLAALLTSTLVPPVTAQSERVYRVTIINRVDRGQPLTPPLIATHTDAVSVFELGSAASFGTQQIAENGDLAALTASLQANPGVYAVIAGPTPLASRRSPGFAHFPDRVSLMISADEGASYLSWESMLICTNDGFTGVDSLRLPENIGDRVSQLTAGYDAGTEVNTEDLADIVPPCQALSGVSSGEPGTATSNPALSEGGVIHHHAGIDGNADLVRKIHDWNRWVTRIVVERVG